ncbi:hypothetical protein CHU98_g12638, partial [Xylaria longipes]
MISRISREVNVQTLHDGQPVRYQLERDDVQEALKTVDSSRDFYLLGLAGLELLISGIANHNGLTTTSSNYGM